MSDSESEFADFDHEVMGRVGGIAVVDVVGTAAIAYLLGNDTSSRIGWFAGLFVLGEVVHVVMKKETPVTKLIPLANLPNR